MQKMSCLKNDLSLIYDVKTNCPSIVNKDEKLTQNKMIQNVKKNSPSEYGQG